MGENHCSSQSSHLFQPSGSPPVPIILHALWKTLDSSWRNKYLWTWVTWKNDARLCMDRQFQKLLSRRMTECWKFQEYASTRVKLSAIIFQEHMLCHNGVRIVVMSPLGRIWVSLMPRELPNSLSINSCWLPNFFPFVLCSKTKMNLYTISSMVTFRDSGESWNLPLNAVQAQLAALGPISKLAQVK